MTSSEDTARRIYFYFATTENKQDFGEWAKSGRIQVSREIITLFSSWKKIFMDSIAI